MKRHHLAICLLLLGGLASCKFVNSLFRDDKGGPSDVRELNASMEQVYVEAEVAKDRIRVAVEALQTLTSPDYRGDPVAGYAVLTVALERCEEHAEKLHETVQEMRDAADPVFSKWEADLQVYASPEMRQRSEERLTATRERYQAVLAAVEPVEEGYDAVNQALRDHALFLSHDLNPAALADVRGEVGTVAESAAELNQNLDACMVATRRYVDAAALPASVPPAPDAQAVPVSGERPAPGR